MIDWLTFELRGVLHRPLHGGKLVAFDADSGDIEWQSRRRKSVAGSASSAIQAVSGEVADDGYASSLRFSGNPSKFVQGHNLYGSDDLAAIVYQVAATLIVHELHRYSALRCEQTDSVEQAATLHTLALAVASRPRKLDTIRTESKSWRGTAIAPVATLPGQATHDVDSPHVRLSRVDLTYMADLGSDHDVLSWISHARRHATFANRGSRRDDPSTVYFASNKSRRARLKFYAKGPEFIVNGPRAVRGIDDSQQDLAYRERSLLADTASGKLRAELELHRVILDELALRYAADWRSSTARHTWLSLMEKFDMPSPADTFDASALPKHLALAYHAWKGGDDLRARYSLRQWYRIRNELRAASGVDITHPCDNPRGPLPHELAPVVPLRQWPRSIAELFPADDEPAPPAIMDAGLYHEYRTDWRIELRPAPLLAPKPAPMHCPWPRDPADHRAPVAA